MIVTFCGHSDARLTESQYSALIQTLETVLTGHPDCTFFLGDYGNFDYLCERAVKSFKKLFRSKNLFCHAVHGRKLLQA